jgi:hypothetical protein
MGVRGIVRFLVNCRSLLCFYGLVSGILGSLGYGGCWGLRIGL